MEPISDSLLIDEGKFSCSMINEGLVELLHSHFVALLMCFAWKVREEGGRERRLVVGEVKERL